MNADKSFLLAERTAGSVARLVDAVDQPLADLPATVRERLPVVLTDLVGVAAAGLRTPELVALLGAWPLPAGEAPLPGLATTTTPDQAALLWAAAACSQELDEGNKHAAGHPAVHVVPAAVAAVQQAALAGRRVSGADFLAAVAGGYEVAARFGRALRRDPAWHTHGHWGATGAALAATRILGGTREQVAAAVDAATGLMTVTPWSAVLAGDVTRNLWAGQANLAGLHAAHLARAGLMANRGGAAGALALLGELDPARLVEDLGERWLTTEGYLKQHAACSYTHAAVDLVLALRRAVGWEPDDVAAVRVGIHSLAAPLLRRHPANRLAAMFSLPFVVATAAVSGEVSPATMTPGTTAFAAAEAFSARVDAAVDPRLDTYLPDRRVCEVEVVLHDGRTLALAAPDPIGDAGHFPLGEAELLAKLDGLLGGASEALLDAVRALEHADDVQAALERVFAALR